MLGDVIKLAVIFVVAALFTVGGIQNHWFSRFSGLIPQTAEAPVPPSAPRAAAAAPAPPPSRSRWGMVELSPDALAQYHTEVEINGVRLDALVDTGASHVSLTAEDARALNLNLPPSAYTGVSHTANGVSRVAPVTLREVRVGDIAVYNVLAVVSEPGVKSMTLLGMSFLKNLSSFQVADGHFVMKQ